MSHSDLSGANLEAADLREAAAIGVILAEAKLTNADFGGANLSGADLIEANLECAKLADTDLSGAKLNHANLIAADLMNADLRRANLGGANLTRANLCSTDLRRANLIDALCNEVNLTGASFWESQRSGWSLKGVRCERAFWDRHGEDAVKYRPGEFEKAFAEKPQIHLEYSDGMSPIDVAMLPLIVERIQAEHPSSALHIRTIKDEGRGATVVIAVDDLSNRGSQAFLQEIATLQATLTGAQEKWLQERDLRLQFQAKYDGLLNDWTPKLLDKAMANKTISIGKIDGPTVVEGTQHVSSITYTTNDLEVIRQHINELMGDRCQWENSVRPEKQGEFEAQLDKLTRELTKNEPDQSLISAGLTSLKNMVESAAGTAVYGASLVALQAFVG